MSGARPSSSGPRFVDRNGRAATWSGRNSAVLAEGRLRFRATGDPADPTRLRLTTIRAELARIVAHRSDRNLHYLDGRTVYGAADAAGSRCRTTCTPTRRPMN